MTFDHSIIRNRSTSFSLVPWISPSTLHRNATTSLSLDLSADIPQKRDRCTSPVPWISPLAFHEDATVYLSHVQDATVYYLSLSRRRRNRVLPLSVILWISPLAFHATMYLSLPYRGSLHSTKMRPCASLFEVYGSVGPAINSLPRTCQLELLCTAAAVGRQREQPPVVKNCDRSIGFKK